MTSPDAGGRKSERRVSVSGIRPGEGGNCLPPPVAEKVREASMGCRDGGPNLKKSRGADHAVFSPACEFYLVDGATASRIRLFAVSAKNTFPLSSTAIPLGKLSWTVLATAVAVAGGV